MLVFGPFLHITLIRQLLKLLNNLGNILQADISNGMPCLFLFLWPSNGIETHRGNQPLYWAPQISFWFWRCDFNLVQTSKIQRNVQGDLILTILDPPVFPNILNTTIFHIHWCELYLSERLPSGATMINRQWCYKFWEFHVHNICKTKLWTISSYFIYLHGFILTLISSRTVQF